MQTKQGLQPRPLPHTLRWPMRIACPTCEATYEVPDALIGSGRLLRCAKCGHEWMVKPEATVLGEAIPAEMDAAPPAEAAPALPAVPPPLRPPGRQPQPIYPPLPTPEEQRRARSATMLLSAAWIGSVLILGALGAGAWAYRAPIVEAWPPAARFYLLLGASQTG